MSDSLPAEVWAHVLSFLSAKKLRKARSTSHLWWNLAERYLRVRPIHTSNVHWAAQLARRGYKHVELYHFSPGSSISSRSITLPPVHTLHHYGQKLPEYNCQRLVLHRQKLLRPLENIPFQLCLRKCTANAEFMNSLENCVNISLHKCRLEGERYKLCRKNKVDICCAPHHSDFDFTLTEIQEVYLTGKKEGEGEDPTIELKLVEKLFINNVLAATQIKELSASLYDDWNLNTCQAHFLDATRFDLRGVVIEARHLLTDFCSIIGKSCRYLYLTRLPPINVDLYSHIKIVFSADPEKARGLTKSFPRASFRILPAIIPMPEEEIMAYAE